MRYFNQIVLIVLLAVSSISRATSPEWNINTNDFEFSMLVVCVAKIGTTELQNSNDQIGAFVGSECRGFAQPIYVSTLNRNVYYLTVMSNTNINETISFKIYNADADVVVDAQTTINFELNKDIGSAYSPFVISTENLRSEIVLSTDNVDENLPIGTKFAQLETWFSGEKVSATYALNEGMSDNNYFTITNDSLITNTNFNYEIDHSFTILITSVVNGGELTDTFSISINNVNEAPTSLTLSNNEIDENLDAPATIGEFSLEDQDTGDTFEFSLLTGGTYFQIIDQKLITKSTLNYEEQNSYSVLVKASDEGNNSIEKEFLITVINQNDAPENISIIGDTICTGLPTSTLIGVCSATDEDTNASLSFSLANDVLDNNDFCLRANGQLMASKTFEISEQGFKYIQVTASDNNGASSHKNLSIVVHDKGYSLNEKTVHITFSNSDYVVENVDINGESVQLEIIPQGSRARYLINSDKRVESYHIYDSKALLINEKNIGENQFILDLATYPTGIYYLNLRTVAGNVTEKIVIQ